MPKSNSAARGMAAAGLLAAFAQLGMAQAAHAGEQAPEPQQSQEQVKDQAPAEQQASQTQQADESLIDLMVQFSDRLFDSQNN